jgi:anti-anti-sigma factor
MSQVSLQTIRFRNIKGVAVVGFPTAYLQDEDDVARVGDALLDLVEGRGFKKVVLSFDGVRLVSSSMLAQMVRLHRTLAKAGGKLRVCCLTPAVQGVVRNCRLDRLLDVHPTEAAAMEMF